MELSWKTWPRRYWTSFSFVGLIFAAIFFAASLSPSLLPRIYLVQGLLSAIALAIGYGIGVLLESLWRYLELPEFGGTSQRVAKWTTTVAATIIAVVFLWRATVWQNSIRELMELDHVATAYPFRVIMIALIGGAFLIAATRIFLSSCRFVELKLESILPRRVAYIFSIVIVASLLTLIATGVLARGALSAADSFFLQMTSLSTRKFNNP